MAVIKIDSNELAELLPTGSETVGGSHQSAFQKSTFTAFSANGYVFPDVFAMDLSWNTDNDLIVHEPEDFGNTIDFSFVIQGGISSEFKSLGSELVLPAGHHNFKFSPGKNHLHKLRKGSPLNVFQISMDKVFFQGLIGCDDRWSESILRKIENQESFVGSGSPLTINPMIKHLIESFRGQDRGPIGNLRRQSILFELLAAQLDQFRQLDIGSSTLEVSVRDKEKLYALRAFLEQHFLDDLSLTSLSRISTLNEFKLKKGFKTLFNTSVFGYISHLRMEYACRLIRDDRRTIEEVADILGYQYSNHFSRAFKKHFGNNPSSLYTK